MSQYDFLPSQELQLLNTQTPANIYRLDFKNFHGNKVFSHLIQGPTKAQVLCIEWITHETHLQSGCKQCEVRTEVQCVGVVFEKVHQWHIFLGVSRGDQAQRENRGRSWLCTWLTAASTQINRQMHLSTVKKQLFRFVTASTYLKDIGCHQCRGETCIFEWQGQKMRLDFWWRWSTFYRVRWRWSRLRLSQRFNPKEENALVTVSEDGTGPWISYHCPSLRYW